MTRRIPRLLLLLLLPLGCGKPLPEPDLRDVRPDAVNVGDKLVVEGRPGAFLVDAPTKVVLDGSVMAASRRPRPELRRLELPARAVSPERVLVDIDEPFGAMLGEHLEFCLLYTSPSPRDRQKSRMPSSA